LNVSELLKKRRTEMARSRRKAEEKRRKRIEKEAQGR